MKQPPFVLTLLLFLSVSLAGCNNSTARFEVAKPSSGSNATLYLYRPEIDKPGLPPLWLQYPEILIDGESHGVLKLNRYKLIELPAGQHHLLLTGFGKQAKWSQRDLEKRINLKAGETYFFRFNVLFDLSDMNLGADWEGKYNISLYPVSENEAIYQIRGLKRTK